MKNKTKKIIILFSVLLAFTTGCGNSKYIKDSENKNVVYEPTGQTIRNDILCKPTEEDLFNIYKENNDSLNIKIENLPECKTFKMSDIKYRSLWESIFVKPLAFILLRLGNLIHNYGVSVMLIGLLIRLILFPFSKKTIKQSENMKKAQPEINKIEKKYKDKTDKDSMMAKSQETMMVYKKYEISPVSGCLMAFIQLPLFLAFLEAINRVPAIFEETIFGIKLGTTPFIGLAKGSIGVKIVFIIIILLIILTTYLSFKNTMNSNPGGSETEKQTQFITKFMIGMISLASFALPMAIALYWIVTNGFSAVQNMLLKRSK